MTEKRFLFFLHLLATVALLNTQCFDSQHYSTMINPDMPLCPAWVTADPQPDSDPEPALPQITVDPQLPSTQKKDVILTLRRPLRGAQPTDRRLLLALQAELAARKLVPHSPDLSGERLISFFNHRADESTKLEILATLGKAQLPGLERMIKRRTAEAVENAKQAGLIRSRKSNANGKQIFYQLKEELDKRKLLYPPAAVPLWHSRPSQFQWSLLRSVFAVLTTDEKITIANTLKAAGLLHVDRRLGLGDQP